MQHEPEIEQSPLCQTRQFGAHTLCIEIYREVGESEWLLEIVDVHGNSTCWDDLFATDKAALEEAKKAIEEETPEAFVGPVDGIPDATWE